MKIAISSNDGVTIANHFGRSRGFIIYDVKNNEIKQQEYRTNNFTGQAHGLAGEAHQYHEHHGHQEDRHGRIMEALKDCQAVISRGMGNRIYYDLHQAGIEAFIVDETDPALAIRFYLNNNLQNHPGRGCNH